MRCVTSTSISKANWNSLEITVKDFRNLWISKINHSFVTRISTRLHSVLGFTVHSIADTVASLLPVLEQVSQDKVKKGILGSLGIGTQSPLSIGNL